eukprot:gene4560-6761_t
MSFRTPMMHRTDITKKSAAEDNNLEEELGFDSDELEDDYKSSGEESDDDDDTRGGVNFVEYLGLQRSLKETTQKKFELHRALQAAQAELRRTKRMLDQSEQRNRMQRGVFEQSHSKQIQDKDNLIDNLRLTLEEMKADTKQTEGLVRMVDQISELTKEKKDSFEKASFLEKDLQLAKEEITALEREYSEQIDGLNKQIEELQESFDPIKAAKASSTAHPSNLDNEEIERLRREAEDLRSKLREAQYAAKASVAASSASADDAGKLEALTRKNDDLREELRTAKSTIAKLQAISAALRESTRKAESLQEELKNEKSARQRLDAELNDLKSSLESQKQALAASGDTQKNVASQLQNVSAELATEKSALKAERAAHSDTKADLDMARKQLEQLKSEMDRVRNDSDTSLRREREKFAERLQETKASHAATIAELKQKAVDDMRDLKERLSDVSQRVQPMAGAIRFLASNYKALSRGMRDLQGEIEPTIKQCKRDLLRTLADVDKQYKEMLRKYRKEMALRKKLHNELVDIRGNIRVFGRIRPVISEDGKAGEQLQVVVTADQTGDELIKVNRKGKANTFELDHVFSPESTQENVFEAARDVITSCIDGFNVCIFAYGQTGSGKTFTMDGPDSNPGLNRRALGHLFEIVKEKQNDWCYEIEVSVLEIYNETVVDLLADKPSKKGLEIRHGKDGPYVEGLSTHVVSSADEVRNYFHQAQRLRSTSSTDMNERSSRSHALLIVYVTGTNLSTGVTSGSAKTIMVVQVAPVMKNVDESVNSLNFAQRVRAVELGQAKKKTESAEVAALKKKLKELNAS